MTPSGSKIRVVHLVRTLEMGGLEMVVLDLVRQADCRWIEPTVLCLGAPGALAGKFESAGVPVVPLHVEGRRLPTRVVALSRALRKIRPDVLHTHNPSPHLNGAIARWMTKIPVLVHTKHGRNYPNRKWPVFQNRFASRLSSCVVPVSRDAAEVARGVERIPERLIRVIYNGIDTDRFTPRSTPKEFSFRAIHVARLNPVKDQLTLLRAVRLVVDEIPNFQLDVVGDGPSADDVRQLREQLDLVSNVHLHGMQDDIPERLGDADMFLLSSLSEGVSLTLLEAMAVALPIVATDVGGNREVVQHGTTGLLVPPSCPKAFADAVIHLCNNPGETNRMGRLGRERAVSQFSLRSMVDSYENLYRELLDQRGFSPLTSSDNRCENILSASEFQAHA